MHTLMYSMNAHYPRKARRGLTLIEVIVTICLVLVLAVVSTQFMPIVAGYGKAREERLTAANVAYSVIEHLREKGRNDFTDADLSAGTHNTSAGITVPAGYVVSYIVTDKTTWGEDNVATDMDFKYIVVTCDYPDDCTLTMQGYVVDKNVQ